MWREIFRSRGRSITQHVLRLGPVILVLVIGLAATGIYSRMVSREMTHEALALTMTGYDGELTKRSRTSNGALPSFTT